MVESATIAEYASDHRATRNAIDAEVQTAKWGLRNRGDTEASLCANGSPPSRAKAKSMRELDVTLERPQNHMAAIATQTSAFPPRAPSAPTRSATPKTCTHAERALSRATMRTPR